MRGNEKLVGIPEVVIEIAQHDQARRITFFLDFAAPGKDTGCQGRGFAGR
jgi:hypothetical protein